MKSFVCLLRGINVGGAHKIKMAELKNLLLSNGFSEVLTYIQSGNILFKSEILNTSEISETVKTLIYNHYGYSINVMTLTLEELDELTANNPFLKDEIDFTKLLVTVFGNTPKTEGIKEVLEFVKNTSDFVHFRSKFMYLHCPTGYGKTKLTGKLLDRKLETSGTTRNWKTIRKIVELSEAYR